MRQAFVRFSLICHNGLEAVPKMVFWGQLLALSDRFRRKWPLLSSPSNSHHHLASL